MSKGIKSIQLVRIGLIILAVSTCECVLGGAKIMAAEDAARHWRIDAGGGVLAFNYTTSAPSAFLQVLYKQDRKYYLIGNFDYLDKFGDRATTYGIGGGYWVGEHVVLNDEVSFSTADIVVPRFQNRFEVDLILPHGFVPTLEYGYRHYNGFADLHLIKPGFNWYLCSLLRWDAQYVLAITDFDSIKSTPLDHSFNTRLTLTPWGERLKFFAFYARTEESFDAGNPVTSGRFHANWVGGGAEAEIYHGFGLRFDTAYENRDNGQTTHGYNAGAFYKF